MSAPQEGGLRKPSDAVLRGDERLPVQWQATIRRADGDVVEPAAASNVSARGLFLRVSQPLEIGARVYVTIVPPEGDGFAVHATVRRVVTEEASVGTDLPVGVGVEVDPEFHNRLAAAVEIARLRQDKAPRLAEPVSEEEAEFFPQLATGPIPPLETADIVGIDFGVSFTGLAVAVGETVCMVRDEKGRPLCPSVLHYPEGGGEPIVGWDAYKLQTRHPDRTIASIKRIAGRPASDPQIGGFLRELPFSSSAGSDDQLLFEIDGSSYAVPQLCAEIIKHVKSTAERRLNLSVKSAVLTVPVSFDESQRNAIKRAGQLAGIERIALLDEPVAAALAYGHGQGKNEIIAVYDFGGGTFDFTILDFSHDHYRVLATAGDAWLGGDDFDRQLAEAVANAFWRRTKIELRNRVVEWRRLVVGCERAKRRLSARELADLLIPEIVSVPKPTDLRQRIERGAFERICHGLFRQSLEICTQAFQSAGLEPRDMTEVVATGGTSRIPFIREGLAFFFEREIRPLVNPEDAVALGAGLFAARLARHPAVRARSIAI